MKKKMEAELLFICDEINRLENAVAKMPEGNFNCICSQGRYLWYRNYPKKSRILIKKSDKELAAQLALKKYYEYRLIDLYERRDGILKFQKKYTLRNRANNYANKSPEIARLIKEAYYADHPVAKEWMEEDYPSTAGHAESLIVKTTAGHMVRSKSEAMIADCLLQEGIPYRYENDIYLSNRKITPDFTVLRMRDMREVLWDHFGLLDDYEYRGNAIWKLGLYSENGYYPGKNLILTYETKEHPFSFQDARQTINEYLR